MLRHSTDHFIAAKQLKIVGSSNFNHPTSAAVRIIIDFRLMIPTMTGGRVCYSYTKLCEIPGVHNYWRTAVL